MLHFGVWSKTAILLVVLLGLLTSLPNFFFEAADDASRARAEIAQLAEVGRAPTPELEERAARWPSFLPSSVVNLGLDLQGGAHFLFEVQVEDVYRDRMESLRTTLGGTLREAGVRRYSPPRLTGDSEVVVRITNAEDVDNARRTLAALATTVGGAQAGGDFLGGGGADLEVVEEADQTLVVRLTELARREITSTVVGAAIEVIRTRVDAYGTREPTIQRQGERRILVQLPGATDIDPEDLTTQAELSFQMVVEGVSEADAQIGRVPRDAEVLEYDPDLNPEFAGRRIAVFKKVDITGDQLAEAQQGFDQNGQIGVNIRFNSTGARVFGDITRTGVGTRFAMVLDGKVLSAPVIRTPINDGRAIITGDFDIESAQALAVNLGSGSLPAGMTVEESSFVGPELGADSIAAGRIACIIGFILVMIFMIVCYGWFGIMADVALMLNVLLIFGALSALGATLTLPGIAGIVLTIGMAVDANVLIFERIREELRRGRKVAMAIETGYARAFSAIIDANVTTFLAAMILFSMGSGPIKGFAVTLGIGILTSVFTAVMLTRFFVASWYGWARPKALAL